MMTTNQICKLKLEFQTRQPGSLLNYCEILLLMTCLIIADKLKDKSSLSNSLDHDFLLETLQKITHRVETVADKIN